MDQSIILQKLPISGEDDFLGVAFKDADATLRRIINSLILRSTARIYEFQQFSISRTPPAQVEPPLAGIITWVVQAGLLMVLSMALVFFLTGPPSGGI